MFYKLESLRGLAACLVILYHSPFNVGDQATSFNSNSYLFVDFFFVLSGFVMALAYTGRIREGLSFKSYFILRLGRIYPLHISILFLWVLYVLFLQLVYLMGFSDFDQSSEYDFGALFSHILLISSLGVEDSLSWNYPSWSISAEFFTYIVFYVLIFVFDKKDSILFPVCIFASAYALLVYLAKDNLDLTYDYGFLRCLAAFYVGVMVLRLYERSKGSKFVEKNVSLLEFGCVFGSAVSLLFVGFHLLYFIPVIILFALSIYVFANQTSGFLGKILELTPFRKIGLWSYSIYMLHALVLEGVAILFQSILKLDIDSISGVYSFIINGLILLCVIFVSQYFYRFIENSFRSKSRELAEAYK